LSPRIFETAIAAELDHMRAERIEPFDVHAHSGADVDGTTRSSDEHLRDLERIGGRSVLFPLCVRTGYEAENERVLAECAAASDRLVPFARLDPRVSGAEAAAAALGAGARGLKLHPRGEDFALEHPNVDAILAAAGEARAPVVVHAGLGVGSFGPILLELAERHPGCPLVLAHAGVSDLAWLAETVPEYPSIFFDTAWLVPSDLQTLFASVPPERILFGSDAPYMDVDLVLAIALRCARHAGLSPEAIGLVFGGQLEALLDGEGPLAADAPAPARPLAAGETRTASLLAAVAGCIWGGGDPTSPLELATLSLGPDDLVMRQALAELGEEIRAQSPDAIAAALMAATLAVTPHADREPVIA